MVAVWIDGEEDEETELSSSLHSAGDTLWLALSGTDDEVELFADGNADADEMTPTGARGDDDKDDDDE